MVPTSYTVGRIKRRKAREHLALQTHSVNLVFHQGDGAMALGFCPVTSGRSSTHRSVLTALCPAVWEVVADYLESRLPTVPHASNLPKAPWCGSASQGLSSTQSFLLKRPPSSSKDSQGLSLKRSPSAFSCHKDFQSEEGFVNIFTLCSLLRKTKSQ